MSGAGQHSVILLLDLDLRLKDGLVWSSRALCVDSLGPETLFSSAAPSSLRGVLVQPTTVLALAAALACNLGSIVSHFTSFLSIYYCNFWLLAVARFCRPPAWWCWRAHCSRWLHMHGKSTPTCSCGAGWHSSRLRTECQRTSRCVLAMEERSLYVLVNPWTSSRSGAAVHAGTHLVAGIILSCTCQTHTYTYTAGRAREECRQSWKCVLACRCLTLHSCGRRRRPATHCCPCCCT